MPLARRSLPSFTFVLTSDHGSTVLRDHQRALSREIQIPVFGSPNGGLMDTIDMRTPTGFIIYKWEYTHDQDTATVFDDQIEEVDTVKFFGHRLKMAFRKFKGFGRKVFVA